jgi:hypothetical protein
MKIHPVGAYLFHADGQTDEQEGIQIEGRTNTQTEGHEGTNLTFF